MEQVRDSLNQKTYRTIGVKNKTTIDYRTIVSSTQADQLVDEATDLINDIKFKPYFFKTLYIIGPTEFIEAMHIARKSEADCRPCIFVKRLRDVRRAVEKNNPVDK